MAKQIKRLKDEFIEEKVSIDNVCISKGQFGYMATIKGEDLRSQVDFGAEIIIETTLENGKNAYYKLRPTTDSGIAIPTTEGYYSLEDAIIWVDNRPENVGNHILRTYFQYLCTPIYPYR